MGRWDPTARRSVAPVGVALLLVGAYLALPSPGWRSAAWVLTGLAAAVAILIATNRNSALEERLPGWLLAAGVSLLTLGQSIEIVGPSSPSYADFPRLLAFAVLSAAVTAFQRDRIRHDRDSLLDALVVTVAAAQAGWMVLIAPLMQTEAPPLDVFVSGAYPLGHLLLLAVATRLGFAIAGSGDGAARRLLAGLLTGVAAGVAAEVTGRPEASVGWFVALALILLAVRHPGMAQPPKVRSAARLATTWRFVVLLGLACLVSPVMVVVHPISDGATKAAVVLGGAGLLFTLALLRIISLLATLRRALRREHVLRSATAELVGAADRAGVRDAALAAATDLLDQPGIRSWRVDGDPGGTVAQATEDADIATFLDKAELAMFPAYDEGIRLLDGPSLLHASLGVPTASTLVLVALPARGAAREGAVIAVETRPSPRTVAALEALAGTMQLALERLDVGEIMVERRSERRLRLMLQYASDVICILDHDLTIVHVTPAVEPIVGLPAPELLGMNWLDVVCDVDRDAAREGAVIAVETRPSPRTVAALEALAGTMQLALERLDVGEIMVERRSERRLRLMLQYASDVICILDHDLTIVHVTPAVEPIVGLPAPELLGMNWLDVVCDVDRDAARDLVSLAQGGRPARGEVRLNNEDGHTRHVDAVVTEVIDEDLMGFVVTCHDITDRHELEQQLTHQAFHDSLTGLANRALFRDRLGHAMARARGTGGYGVLFVDLDDFKTVNDSLGHAAGDELLREMTGRLRTVLRDGDTAARLGGDEFAILLEDVDGDEPCTDIAQRLLEALAEPFDIGGTEVTTGASIGIAVGQVGPASPEDLMRNADLALYDAKNAGKNRYAVFATTMHEAALARLSLTSDLRHSIERGELVVHYQPLVDLESARIIGLEALVRWMHPRLGMLRPGEFIGLAEETGLIVPLGRLVLQTALRETVRWQREHESHQDLHIAVNVSGRQLQDPGIVDDVRLAINASGIRPSTVVLEITESVLLPGDGVIVERLHALAALGVHLYIDDFGTGYSSLSYLQMLPVNGLKLAQEFVETLPGSETEAGLVRTIRDLAGTLGLSAVVAEGIERPEQWRSLLSLGYSVGQGFHLALPMPADRIPEFLTGLARPGEGDWHAAAREAQGSALR